MSSGFRCRDCGSQFASPSFSEGPKVWDETLRKVVRFRECRYLCPDCLSTNIAREDAADSIRVS